MSKKLAFPAQGKRLFDTRPILLPGWTLRHNAAEPSAKPNIDETASALDFAVNASEVSPYWVGDIARYAESREDWEDKIDQLLAITGYEEKTIVNLASLARHVGEAARQASPSLSHAKIVQKLDAKEQLRWLKKAKTEGWGTRELDQELKAAQKRGVLKGSTALEGTFRVWLADFPWKYRQGQPSKVSAESHYPGMTVQQGIKMGSMIEAHTTKHAVLFFWVTAPMLYYATDKLLGPDAYRIITAWGFEPKSGGVWDKVDHTFGHYLSIRHEHLIIATRGACTPDHPTPMIDSVFTERKSHVHSEKPECVYKMIERLYEGERCEMFARKERRGWTCYGNQIGAPLEQTKAG